MFVEYLLNFNLAKLIVFRFEIKISLNIFAVFLLLLLVT